MDTSLDTHDIIARGQALFDTTIRPRLAQERPGDLLAIDVRSGDFQVSADDMEAEDRLRVRHPDAALFVRRVGDAAAHFVGQG